MLLLHTAACQMRSLESVVIVVSSQMMFQVSYCYVYIQLGPGTAH